MTIRDPENICDFARKKEMTRGLAVLCSECKGEKSLDFKIPFINKEDICIATTFYNTGHFNPSVQLNTDEMYKCEYRKYK
jgi:hypothetical protein